MRHLGETYKAQQLPPQQNPPPPSEWKSPVPYLFGGLAAMLGLMAFALLILACSYWRLSSRQRNAVGDDSGEATSDEKLKDVDTKACLNSILVIMAGDEKPTFLATPITSGASSSGGCCDCGEGGEVMEVAVVTTDDEKK